MSEVLVLYQISNEISPGGGGRHAPPATPSYNAYYMSRSKGITLATIKQSCRALQSINPDGANGYHWRVRIDEKPNTSHSSAGGAGGGNISASGGGGGVAYSWWDVQDENARLPVKEATPSELKRMLVPKIKKEEGDVVTQEVAKAAKGAMKYMGKAMNAVAASSSGGTTQMDDDLHAPRTPVICFKLLDLGKVRRGLDGGGGAGRASGGARRAAPSRSSSGIIHSRSVSRGTTTPSSRASSQQQPQQRQQRPAAAPISAGAPRIPQQASRQPQRPPVAKSTPPTADLMGFNSAAPPAATAPQRSDLHHANSMPARTSVSTPTGAKPGENRAQKAKREYAKKQATSNRVWDDIDQRWVEGPVKNGETSSSAASSSIHNNSGSGADSSAAVTASVKGISLSRDNAIGKSANVQAAVDARITDMEQSQQKAITELRARESQKATADAEEDVVRQRLEPKLKAWGEEHGRKKQLRALLANLHTILWEGSGWKPVNLADVLDDKKVKRVYHKASRVVHPDKTHHLDAEKRFVANRVFDFLTQAKVEFDAS